MNYESQRLKNKEKKLDKGNNTLYHSNSDSNIIYLKKKDNTFQEKNKNHRSCLSCIICHHINKMIKYDKKRLSEYIKNNDSNIILFGNSNYNNKPANLFIKHNKTIVSHNNDLIPLPINSNNLFSNIEKNKLYDLQRSIVMMRRFQYNNKLNEDNNLLKLHYSKIILIQKIYKGYLVRKEIKNYKILCNCMDKFEKVLLNIYKRKVLKKIYNIVFKVIIKPLIVPKILSKEIISKPNLKVKKIQNWFKRLFNLNNNKNLNSLITKKRLTNNLSPIIIEKENCKNTFYIYKKSLLPNAYFEKIIYLRIIFINKNGLNNNLFFTKKKLNKKKDIEAIKIFQHFYKKRFNILKNNDLNKINNEQTENALKYNTSNNFLEINNNIINDNEINNQFKSNIDNNNNNFIPLIKRSKDLIENEIYILNEYSNNIKKPMLNCHYIEKKRVKLYEGKPYLSLYNNIIKIPKIKNCEIYKINLINNIQKIKKIQLFYKNIYNISKNRIIDNNERKNFQINNSSLYLDNNFTNQNKKVNNSKLNNSIENNFFQNNKQTIKKPLFEYKNITNKNNYLTNKSINYISKTRINNFIVQIQKIQNFYKKNILKKYKTNKIYIINKPINQISYFSIKRIDKQKKEINKKESYKSFKKNYSKKISNKANIELDEILDFEIPNEEISLNLKINHFEYDSNKSEGIIIKKKPKNEDKKILYLNSEESENKYNEFENKNNQFLSNSSNNNNNSYRKTIDDKLKNKNKKNDKLIYIRPSNSESNSFSYNSKNFY